jgi:predicted TIM-barrel fold metal-dependent hydrolase
MSPGQSTSNQQPRSRKQGPRTRPSSEGRGEKRSIDKRKEPSSHIREGGPAENGSKSGFYTKLNTILVIFIVVSAAVLIYRLFYLTTPESDGEPENGNGPIVGSIIPAREAGIINGHEHIQNVELAERWLGAMDQTGVSSTIMVGSPDATFYLHPEGRFEKYKDSNEVLLQLVDKYPDRFIAFPTIYTYDDDKVELLKDYVKRGAIGLKLFTGHYASFHDYLGPLNVSDMDPVYEYCQRERVPIIWHVHLGIDEIRAEFEDVLSRYPNLIINIPHFGLSSIKISRLEFFLETYPNLYTDVSFGYWAKAGLWRISNHSAFYGEKITKFQDRFTFGTDMVCTIHPRKTVEWIANLTQGYRDILEKEYFSFG